MGASDKNLGGRRTTKGGACPSVGRASSNATTSSRTPARQQRWLFECVSPPSWRCACSRSSPARRQSCTNSITIRFPTSRRKSSRVLTVRPHPQLQRRDGSSPVRVLITMPAVPLNTAMSLRPLKAGNATTVTDATPTETLSMVSVRRSARTRRDVLSFTLSITATMYSSLLMISTTTTTTIQTTTYTPIGNRVERSERKPTDGVSYQTSPNTAFRSQATTAVK